MENADGGAVARFKYCFSGFHYSLVACLGDVHFAITRGLPYKGATRTFV